VYKYSYLLTYLFLFFKFLEYLSSEIKLKFHQCNLQILMMIDDDVDDDVAMVVPHSNLYIVVSPVCAMVDYLTIEWLNEFLLDLAKRAVSPAIHIKY